MVKIIYRDKEWELKGGMTVRSAILKAGLDPEAVLAVRDGKLINEETILKNGDIIKLIAVISGGDLGERSPTPSKSPSPLRHLEGGNGAICIYHLERGSGLEMHQVWSYSDHQHAPSQASPL